MPIVGSQRNADGEVDGSGLVQMLAATLGAMADDFRRVGDMSIRLRGDLRPGTWNEVVREFRDRLILPEVAERALTGLKFSDALPSRLAVAASAGASRT